MNKTLLSVSISFIICGTVGAEEAKLLAYWPMNEGKGVKINDVSGNKYNGILLNPQNSEWVDGPSGKALYFKNTPKKTPIGKNAAVKIAKLGQYDFEKGFSITALVKTPPKMERNGRYEIFGNNYSRKGLGFHLFIGWQMLMFYCCNGKKTAIAKSLISENVIKPDTWYHVAAVYNRKSSKIYLNGQLVGSNENAIFAKGLNYISIGAANAGAHYGFDGIISDVRLYAGAMKDIEIAKLAKGL